MNLEKLIEARDVKRFPYDGGQVGQHQPPSVVVHLFVKQNQRPQSFLVFIKAAMEDLADQT